MRRSLLLSADEEAVRVLTRLLRDLDIEVDHHTDPHLSVQQLVEERFDAVVLDADDNAGAALVLRTMRGLPSAQHGLIVVLAQSRETVYLGFSAGAHLALYKPITVERVALGVRAIGNLIARERRRGSERVPANIPASLGDLGATGVPLTIVDLSSSGAAIRGDRHLPSSGLLTLHSLLPGTTTPVMFTAEVVWQDASGRSGIRFVNVALASRQILNEWLRAKLPGNSTAAKAKAAGASKTP
jgi:CheY-like chemotaxis protein